MGAVGSRLWPLWTLIGGILGILVFRIGFAAIFHWKREDGRPLDKYFAWRAIDGGPLDDYHGREVIQKMYNETTHTAVGCYKDTPEVCGTMYGVIDGCGAWMNLVDEQDWGDDQHVGIFEPWNPNGTLFTDNPTGGTGTRGQWIMSVTVDDLDECARHMPDRRKPINVVFVTKGLKDFTDDIPDFPEQMEKRSISAVQQLESHFAKLPHAGALDDIVTGAAKLMHRHMGNSSITQAETLFHAFHTILDKSKKRHAAWSLVRRGSLSADRVITSLHKEVLATAYEEDRNWLDLLSNGAAMKAVAKRGEEGTAGKADVDLMNWVMDKVHGPVKPLSLVQRLRSRMPGYS